MEDPATDDPLPPGLSRDRHVDLVGRHRGAWGRRIGLGVLLAGVLLGLGYSVTGAVLAIATIALMTVGLSYLGYRFRGLRPLLEGEPVVLVDGGRVIERNMRRERITLDEPRSEARLAQIPALDDVRWAVLETTGKISFIKR